MSFDEVMLWLVTAMSLTAVVFLIWTLAAVVRTSRHGSFGPGSQPGRPFSAMAPRDRGPA